MIPTRRDFLKATGAVGAGLALGGPAACSADPDADPNADDTNVSGAPSSKRLLILGGTGFIGPHMVRYATERGHEVSIFTRGRSPPGWVHGQVLHLFQTMAYLTLQDRLAAFCQSLI